MFYFYGFRMYGNWVCRVFLFVIILIWCLWFVSVKDLDKLIKFVYEGDEEEDLVFEDDDYDRLNRVSSNGYMDSFCKVMFVI